VVGVTSSWSVSSATSPLLALFHHVVWVMAHHASVQHCIPSPAVVALKNDAGVGPDTSRNAMERSFSQDIQEGSQDLKEAAEQTRNIILDLSLDGIIRWVSPSWVDVVGSTLEAVKGNPISNFIHDNPNVFEPAIAALKSNYSKSQFVKFSVKVPPASDLQPMLLDDDDDASDMSILELEGQGIMVYERATGRESHVSLNSRSSGIY
jgi:serine/threonine-protein kinase RIM15